MRKSIPACFVLGIVVAILWSSRQNPTEPPPHRPINPADLRVSQLKFNNATLAQDVDLIARRTRANIVVHWQSLASIGFDPGRKIHIEIGDQPLKRALRILFTAAEDDSHFNAPAAAWTGAPTVAIWTRGDVIYVTRSDQAAHFTMGRLYDVNAFWSHIVWPPAHTATQAPTQPPPPVSAAGGGIFGFTVPPAIAAKIDCRPAEMDIVTLMIERTCAPASWRDNGGRSGAIWATNGFLLIDQTPEVHERIDRLAAAWAASRAAHEHGESPSSAGIDLRAKQ